MELFILQEGLTGEAAAKAVESITIRARRFSERTQDGQMRHTVELFKGADPTDVFEDFSEDAFTRALDGNLVDGHTLLDGIHPQSLA